MSFLAVILVKVKKKKINLRSRFVDINVSSGKIGINIDAMNPSSVRSDGRTHLSRLTHK